jgi:hypothetical protein
MTANQFRKIATSFPGVVESAHMDHPDFRVEGKIFATLGYPDESSGMIKLTSDQQRSFTEESPSVFSPCNGAWGRRGATSICLASAKPKILKAALATALENVRSQAKKK